jgi:hypothetical protein
MSSPNVWLYVFVVITQFVYGLYLGLEIEPPAAYSLLHWYAQLWIIGWWLLTDSRKRDMALVYDIGFFLYLAWPLVMPYYPVKTRRLRGLLVILVFSGAYLGASLAGVILSVSIAVFHAQP